MVSILRLLLIGSLLLFIQVGAGRLLDISGVRPDLLLVFILSITFKRGRYFGLAAGFLFGVAQDLFTIGFLGVNALSKSTVAFWFGTWLAHRESAPRALNWLVLFTLCTFIQEVITGFFFLLGTDRNFGNYLVGTILPTAVYTGLLGFLWVLIPFKSVKGGKTLPRSKWKSTRDI